MVVLDLHDEVKKNRFSQIFAKKRLKLSTQITNIIYKLSTKLLSDATQYKVRQG
jgi:hypothetical protein